MWFIEYPLCIRLDLGLDASFKSQSIEADEGAEVTLSYFQQYGLSFILQVFMLRVH